MIIFGLTGGSGTGKSTVSKILEKNGIYIIDADIVARRVVRKGTQCLDELAEMFGTEILQQDGTLNRKKLGKIVFSNKEKLKILNRITHHYIKCEIEREIKSIKDFEYIAIDGAVIIGSPIEKLCNFLVVVNADYDVRLNRIKLRDDLTDEDAKNRLLSQPGPEFYKANAKYIIENNSTFESLQAEVNKVAEMIMNK